MNPTERGERVRAALTRARVATEKSIAAHAEWRAACHELRGQFRSEADFSHFMTEEGFVYKNNEWRTPR